MKVPNLKTWQPQESDAKPVEDTKMLDTTARESMDYNESNDVGKEHIVVHPAFPTLGMRDRGQ